MGYQSSHVRNWMALAVALLLGASCLAVEAQPLVPGSSLTSLLVSEEDLPSEALLGYLSVGTEEAPYGFYCASPFQFHEVWRGEPSSERGGNSTDYSITISLAITDSPSQAVRDAIHQVNSAATRLPEITGKQPIAPYADRAWGRFGSRGGHVRFTKANVLVNLFGSWYRDKPESPDMLARLVSRISKKIDDALAKRPASVPVLPLSIDQNLGLRLGEAWRLREPGRRLWGAEGRKIAIEDSHGIPRYVPAKPLPDGDYLVPLRHVVTLMDPEGGVLVRGSTATVVAPAKSIKLKSGDTEGLDGSHKIPIGRAVEFREDEVVVPVSFVERVFGKSISWSKRGDLPVGKLKNSGSAP